MLDNIRKMTLSCYCGECMHDITPYIEDGSKILVEGFRSKKRESLFTIL